MQPRFHRPLWASLLLLAACDGASPITGQNAMVVVSYKQNTGTFSGQFVPGAMPAATDGPAVESVTSFNNRIWAGERNKSLKGNLAPGGVAVAIGIEGDIGYWTIPAAEADFLLPDDLTFNSVVTFAERLQPRTMYPLIFRAIDDRGRFGLPHPLILTTADQAPKGDLVVSLSWDTEADLDLHLALPSGIIVWARHTNAYQPPEGMDIDPQAAIAGGHLDFDSNANCTIDGRRQENVVFAGTPADLGHYIVRVDTFSLCGEVAARWSAEAQHCIVLNPMDPKNPPMFQCTSIKQAYGFSGDSDSRFTKEAASGLTAFEFDL